MSMSIKLVQALDGATVRERVVDVAEDGRIGKYRMLIEKGEQTAFV